MLILVSGASGSGKTTLVQPLASRLSGLSVHELGEFADRRWNGEPGWMWRREPVGRAVDRALAYEADGVDMVVTEGVFGELLASPRATELEGIACCLVDCDGPERIRRLKRRERESAIDPHALWDHVVWGLWLRMHARDPQLFTGPIRGSDDGGWAWQRWSHWQEGDQRWVTFVLDTTDEPIEASLGQLTDWVQRQRALRDEGRLPLSGDWPGGH